MTNIVEEFLYLQEVPFWIEERAKEGYTEFHISLKDVKKPRRERVVIKAWKRLPDTSAFTCECGEKCRNPATLEMHQRVRKHGPFNMKSLYSGGEISA